MIHYYYEENVSQDQGVNELHKKNAGAGWTHEAVELLSVDTQLWQFFLCKSFNT